MWINPEEQLLAAGVLAEDVDYDERQSLAGPGQPSWAFFDERSALAFAAPLCGWSLDVQGPYSPIIRRVQELRSERERREAEAAAERDRRERERARARAEREARARWREQNAERLERKRAEHEARDLMRWRAAAPRILEACGGELPEAFRQRLKADRFVFLHHEHWHALVYLRNIYRLQAGESTTYRDIARTVFEALAEAGRPAHESRWIYAAITGLLFHLRRAGWVDFDVAPGSWFIGSPICIGSGHPGARPRGRRAGVRSTRRDERRHAVTE